MKESTWTGTDTVPSGRHEIPSVRPRSARPDPVRCGCGCQKLVQPTICPHSHMPLEVWASPSSHRAPHSAPNTQDPYFCSARGDIQGISHIACISLPGPFAALPVPRDLARCPSGAVWHQQSGPWPCHRHTTLPDTICLSYSTHFDPTS